MFRRLDMDTLIVYHDWLQTSQKVISMRTRELKEPQEWKGENVSIWELPIVQGTPWFSSKSIIFNTEKTFWSEKAWDVNFGLWYHRLFKRIWSPLVNFIFMPARLSKQLGCDKRKSVKLFRKHVSDKQCLLFKMHHSLAMPPFSKLAIPKCLLQTIILAS